jgi:hypothetical protein
VGTAIAPASCAGSNNPCGDGGLATSAQLSDPTATVVDAAGDLYIADAIDQRIRKVNAATGIISTVAGTGNSCGSSPNLCGDGASATSSGVGFQYPQGLALDAAGNLFIADTLDSRVVEVSTADGITFPTATPAGTADSTDGTETATLNDIGNLPLTIASMQNNSGNFVVGNPLSGGCSTSVNVAAGDSCLLGEQFAPAAGSPALVVGSLAVMDNSLNATSATQFVPLSGTTTAGGLLVAVGSVAAETGTSTVTLAASVGYGGSLPTGAVTFTVNGSSTGVGTVTCKAKASHLNCTASYDTSTLIAGNYTITASVPADSNYSAASGNGTLEMRGSSSGVHVSPVTMVAPVKAPVAAVRSAIVAAPVAVAAPVEVPAIVVDSPAVSSDDADHCKDDKDGCTADGDAASH